MRNFRPGRRLATAAVIAAAAIGAAGPAQADQGGGKGDACEGGEQRLEQRFREIEAKRGWEAAAKWWDKAWERYYESCLAP
jgi:hypothetical protein